MKRPTASPSHMRYLFLLPLALLGVGSILATTNPADATPSAAGYLFASWNCGSSTQCANVMGHATGSAGPFCTRPACDKWRQTYFVGATCDAAPRYTVWAQAPKPCQS